MEVNNLYNSIICRLCGEENENGVFIYAPVENEQNLCDLINTYLPLKVSDDGHLPRSICPGCNIQLEATMDFINLIIKGQQLLRSYFEDEEELKWPQLDKSKTNAKIDEIQLDGSGLYKEDHKISLKVAGIDKPKKKRGRPPKREKTAEELAQESLRNAQNDSNVTAPKENVDEQNEELNCKRKRKVPTRYREAVQGKELERMFIQEGVIDGAETSDVETKSEIEETPKVSQQKVMEVIGRSETSGELVVVVKGKGRGRPKGSTGVKRQTCAICNMEFTCVGRYMAHVAQHVAQQGAHSTRHSRHSTLGALVKAQNGEQQEAQNGAQDGAQTVTPLGSSQLIVQNHKTYHNKKHQLSKTKENDENESERSAAIEQSAAGTIEQKLTALLDNTDAEIPEIVENPDIVENIGINEMIDLAPSEGSKVENAEGGQNTEGNSEDTITSELVESKKDKNEEEGVPQEKKKLKCNLCDKMFSNRQSKSMHMKATHAGERPYKCVECGLAFPYPRSLSLHALTHRRTNSKKGFACDLCGKVLNHPSSVVYHKAAEHANESYICNKCNKTFKHKQLLQRHQLVHSQLRPYNCKMCTASFKTKANLINHQMLHSGIKKYSCGLCPQKFAHKTSLTLHMRWHTGQKPYSCLVCSKKFSQKGNLSEHLRIHTGEKPYSCAECGRRFTTSSQYRMHARRHGAGPGAGEGEGDEEGEGALCPRKHRRWHAPTPAQHEKPAADRVIYVSYDVQQPPPHAAPALHIVHPDATDNNLYENSTLLVDSQMSLSSPIVMEEQESMGVEEMVEEEEEADMQLYFDEDSEVIMDEEGEMTVTDEHGNPLHFTMPDGSHLAVTSVDGKTLQVTTQEGQTIPVELNGFTSEEELQTADTVVHPLSMHKTVQDQPTQYYIE